MFHADIQIIPIHINPARKLFRIEENLNAVFPNVCFNLQFDISKCNFPRNCNAMFQMLQLLLFSAVAISLKLDFTKGLSIFLLYHDACTY